MSSSDAPTPAPLASADRAALLNVARSSIDYGLTQGTPLRVAAADFPEALREQRATFVTLRIAERLRGCMGSLHATAALVADVAQNAYMAAFRDPRFAPLSHDEYPGLAVHVSVLGRPEPIAFESEEHLISLIRPGIDGLTLIEGRRRGTLLPSVWKSLSDPREFLVHLKRKAGLEADYWSATVRVERYTTESIGE